VTTRATAQAGVNLGGALMVYVPTGPQLNERMYAKREENPPGKRPICCLKGWIEASAPLHIGAGIKGLTFGREKLLGDETELACAQNGSGQWVGASTASGTASVKALRRKEILATSVVDEDPRLEVRLGHWVTDEIALGGIASKVGE